MPRFVRDSGPTDAPICIVGNQTIKLSDVVRFINFVHPKNGCWLWQASITAKGYAKFWWGGKQGLAMHFALLLANRPKPSAKHEPDHLCRKRACSNPEHLEWTTRRVNVLRGLSPVGLNSRKTHCKRGHLFNEKNTYRVKRNGRWHRHCRTCLAVRAKAKYRANPEPYKARQRGYRAAVR